MSRRWIQTSGTLTLLCLSPIPLLCALLHRCKTNTMFLLVKTTDCFEITTRYSMVRRLCSLGHICLIRHNIGRPCDEEGKFLPPGTLPSEAPPKSKDNWDPFHSRLEFELADFLYSRSQMAAAQIDSILDIWAASLLRSGANPLYNSHNDM